MGLFHRIFSSPRVSEKQEALPTQAYACKAALALPPYTPAEDREAWQAELYATIGLLQEVNEIQDMNGAREQEKLILGAPLRPVHRATLLERAHFADPKYLSPRLHANRLPGSVVMATPTFAQRQLWRDNAREHQVSHVVRIGTDVETVMMDLCPREPLSEAHREWNVPLGADVAVPPGLLLKTFDSLQSRPPQEGHRVAFQSPNGDDRSAVFAAGWKVYKDLVAAHRADQPIDDRRVQNAVRDAVLQMRMARSTTLLTEAGHVASLMAMGQQLKQRLQPSRIRFSPSVTARVFTERPTEPSRSSPRLDRARDLAQARGICQDIRDKSAATDLPFASLKGSTAGKRRIHQDRMLKPDARLLGLHGAPTRLLGAWAAPRTLVLERPGADRSLAWAVACLTHNIGVVVDVGDAAESRAAIAMQHGTQTFENDTEATFSWSPSGKTSLEEILPGGSAVGMHVSARVKGEALTRDVSRDPPFMDRKHIVPTKRPLELVHAPLPKGKPVPPKRLLEIAKILEGHRAAAPADTVALQCPEGDVRAAVVAAADLLYCQFQEGKLTEDNRTEATQEIWTRLCLDYSIDLADEPEQLASLLALADLLLAEGKRTFRWQE